MFAGPHAKNSKFHGPTGGISAGVDTSGMTTQVHSGATRNSIEGESHDLPGSHAFQMLTSDYGEGRHTAYDSPLAQPAYSEHGKVRVM